MFSFSMCFVYLFFFLFDVKFIQEIKDTEKKDKCLVLSNNQINITKMRGNSTPTVSEYEYYLEGRSVDFCCNYIKNSSKTGVACQKIV